MITVTSVLTTGEPVEVKGVCADFEGPYCTTDLRGQQAKCLKCYLEEVTVASWLRTGCRARSTPLTTSTELMARSCIM